ncbi:hypothetical protein C8R43DRAFT_1065424 [Mycena crocata]|nr:hypothetical protein C8R43DRAFT_1065424 [Mycena crocata]
MKLKVAVAGATAGVGRCIADSILEHGTHDLVVLSRSPHPALSVKGAIVRVVLYSSSESLITALSDVHTVISAVGNRRSADAQLALVHAAVAASVVRFLPSGWSAVEGGADDVVELYRPKQLVLDALRCSPLHWSHPECGIFLNYLATPTEGIGPLKPLKFWIDVENCKAVIPGDGNQTLVYTAAEDVGKFIAKALDVEEEWPQALRIVGTRVTHNELIKIAEEIRGRPFDVVYKSSLKLADDLILDAVSPYVNLTTELSLALLDGRFTFEANFTTVASSFRFVQPLDFMKQWCRPVD